MSVHLNEDQLTQWLLGSRDVAVAGHLELCSACRGEADALQRRLALFADTIRAAAARDELVWMRQRAAIRQAITPVRTLASLRWAVAGGLCAALIATIMITQAPQQVSAPAPRVALADAADDALLLQIQNDLARPVPAALQPAQAIADERSAHLQARAGANTNPAHSGSANERQD